MHVPKKEREFIMKRKSGVDKSVPSSCVSKRMTSSLKYVYKDYEKNEKCKQILLSDKAFAKIVSETLSYGENETGGVLIGYISNGIWYVTDVIDAGLKQDTTHTVTYFVYDENYVNHRIQREGMIYKYQPTCLGFFHRHPNSFDRFSAPDERTMKEHCRTSKHGIISMLVNIDPHMRFTFYYASKKNELFRVSYKVGEKNIPKEFFEVATYDLIAERLNTNICLTRPDLQKVIHKEEKSNTKNQLDGNWSRGHGAKKIGANTEKMVSFESSMLMTDKKLLERIEKMDANRYLKQDKLVVPENLMKNSGFEGPLYGFMPTTGEYTVLSWGTEMEQVLGSKLIGYKIKSNDFLKNKISEAVSDLIFVKDNTGWLYNVDTNEMKNIELEEYALTQSLVSRNSGLLESNWMNEATVVISGCGSVGSLIAYQMARSGVGTIVLIDPDNLEIHNIARHQLNLVDIGRKKVDAVAEKLKLINPNVIVKAFARSFQDVPISCYIECIRKKEKTLFIGACDNRVGNANVCHIASDLGIAFAAIGFLPRAWGTEIFTMLPGQLDYETVFEKQIKEAVLRERSNHLYLDEEDKSKVTFEPGLDVDIEYGTSFFDKIVLDILNRDNENYHMRILDQLTQYTLLPGTQDIPDAFYKKYLQPLSPMPIELDATYYELANS